MNSSSVGIDDTWKRDAGIELPDVLTAQLMMLIQGAIVGAQFQGCCDGADHARTAAAALIN